MWESQTKLQGQHASPSAPPNVATSQLDVFTDPFPQQGFMTTQPPHGPVASQPSPSGSSDYQILMMNSDHPLTVDLNLQTWSRQYTLPPTQSVPESSSSSGSTEPLSTPNGSFHIPQPKDEVHTKIPKGPLHQNVTLG